LARPTWSVIVYSGDFCEHVPFRLSILPGAVVRVLFI
jgi:hypothetical protein